MWREVAEETRCPSGIERIRAVLFQTSGAHVSLIRLVWRDETVGRCVLLQDIFAANMKIWWWSSESQQLVKTDAHIFFMWSRLMWPNRGNVNKPIVEQQQKKSSPVWKIDACVGSDSPWESAFAPLWQQHPKSHFPAARSRYGAAWNDLKQ